MLCDHLEGWDREGGREMQEGGDMGISYISHIYHIYISKRLTSEDRRPASCHHPLRQAFSTAPWWWRQRGKLRLGELKRIVFSILLSPTAERSKKKRRESGHIYHIYIYIYIICPPLLGLPALLAVTLSLMAGVLVFCCCGTDHYNVAA